jgi:hypothetical protein
MVWVSFGDFWQTPSGMPCAFYWGVASIWPLYHKGLIGGVLQRWLSFWKFLPSPQRNSRTLSEWPSGSWSPPWPRTFPLIAQFGQVANSRKSLGGSKLLPFKNDGGHCVLGDLPCCRNVLVPFPRSVPLHNPVSELYRQFFWPHGLVFALTCTVNWQVRLSKSCPINGIYYRWTPSCINISRMINGNRMHLSSISSVIANSLHTYVNKVFLFFLYICKKF